MLGMPALYDGSTGTFDIVKLVNCTHELLNKNARQLRVKEEAEDKYDTVAELFLVVKLMHGLAYFSDFCVINDN